MDLFKKAASFLHDPIKSFQSFFESDEERKRREEEQRRRTQAQQDALFQTAGKVKQFAQEKIVQPVEDVRKKIIEEVPPYVDKLFKGVKTGFPAGAGGTKALIKGAGALVTGAIEDQPNAQIGIGPFGFSPFKVPEDKKISTRLQQSAQRDLDQVGEYVRNNFPADEGKSFSENIKDPGWLGRGLGMNVPNLLASLGVSITVGLITKNPIIATKAGFGTSFTLEGGGSYLDAKKAGVEERKARNVGLITGMVNGFLDVLPIANVLNRLSGGPQIKKKILAEVTKNLVKQAGLEASTESLQEVIANATASVYDKNRDLFAGVPEAALFGGILGGGVGITTDVASSSLNQAMKTAQYISDNPALKSGFAKLPFGEEEAKVVPTKAIEAPKPIVPKYKSAIDALNDPAYIAKLKAARGDRVTIIEPNLSTTKMPINKLIDTEGAPITEIQAKIPDFETSVTKGPIEVAKTESGYMVLDGQHRAGEAIKAGKSAIEVNILSKEEALKKYGDQWVGLEDTLTPTQATGGVKPSSAQQAIKDGLTEEQYVKGQGKLLPSFSDIDKNSPVLKEIDFRNAEDIIKKKYPSNEPISDYTGFLTTDGTKAAINYTSDGTHRTILNRAGIPGFSEQFYLRYGGIRLHNLPKEVNIEIGNSPTLSQLDALDKLSSVKNINYDFLKDGKIVSSSPMGGVNKQRFFKDLQDMYSIKSTSQLRTEYQAATQATGGVKPTIPQGENFTILHYPYSDLGEVSNMAVKLTPQEVEKFKQFDVGMQSEGVSNPNRMHLTANKSIEGLQRSGVKLVTLDELANKVPELKSNIQLVKPTTGKTTLAKIEKANLTERFERLFSNVKSQEDYVSRVGLLSKELDKPEVRSDKKRLRQVRSLVRERFRGMTGVSLSGNWKKDYAIFMQTRQDPDMADGLDALEDLMLKLDDLTGGRMKKEISAQSESLGLPAEGKYFIPYGKYSTHGTGNRTWVQENIPLIYMGNKRGMVGYILDVLGIKQKDLGNLTASDVKQLDEVTNVVDLFGGSGLMSNLSKKFFPNAKITYNELDPQVLKAIEKAQTDPKVISRFVSEIALWLNKNPEADWLGHFNTVYKNDADFAITARFIEALGGRTGEITALKLRSLLKAIPNFAKTLKGVTTTNEDALDILDRYIANGTSKDFLWVDPPYLWSTGYAVGAPFERSEGFMKLIDKLSALNKKGVKFVFFNNDPEVQVLKGGIDTVHIQNVMGKINQLSEDGAIVIKGINPIGAAVRREMMITNLTYGLDTGRLLNLEEVQTAIASLRDDPAAAPREILKMYRDIRGTSEFAPEGQRISAHQIKTIRTLRSRLRIKNREMVPVLDELLGDTSFAKMTKEDGVKMIDWLQPRNFDVIENKIALTKKMLAGERQKALLGERFASKTPELESKFGALASMNKTVESIENFVKMINNLPDPTPDPNAMRRIFGGLGANLLPEDVAAKILGIKQSYQTPMRTIVSIGTTHTNRMKTSLSRVFQGLTKEDKQAVVYLQAGAEKQFKGTISDRAREIAKYIQEVAEANIAITNRLRAAKGQPPLKPRKPYIPYIVDQDIAMAANLGDRNKFWEQRTKTPTDFAAGLFTADPARIIDIWAESSGSWLKKNLFGATMMDRYEATFKVSDAASAYARQITELDIYNMLPESQKMIRAVGNATNDFVGSIFPRRIPVDETLAKSILNTTFGQELRDDIAGGYLTVPRVQIPNLGSVFHRVFYPAKLAWNFGFYALNRTQVIAGLPFVGVEAKVKGFVAMHTMLFPWNRGVRAKYASFLEEAGYEYGRLIAGQELPDTTQKVGIFIDRSVNFLGDISEFQNRMETMLDMKYFLESREKSVGVKISESDKLRVAAQFSAFINFLAGKGFSPVAQRGMAGRFLYTFAQYPLNQFNVFHEMLGVTLRDKGVKDLLTVFAREGGASDKFFEFVDAMPKSSRPLRLGKFFLVLMALSLPIAILYSQSRSWNVASRALPGVPRITPGPIISALLNWISDPSDTNAKEVTGELKKFMSIGTKDKLEDALNILDFGTLQNKSSGRPLFVENSIENATKVLLFGRSALEEYDKAYPSSLSKIFGGNTAADKVKKLQQERKKTQGQETQNAVEIMKELINAETPEDKKQVFRDALTSGKFTEGSFDKLIKYIKEDMQGVGPLENQIIDLKDEDQARFIAQEIKAAGSKEERLKLFKEYVDKGILTENVMKEILRLAGEGTLTPQEQPNLFQKLFQ